MGDSVAYLSANSIEHAVAAVGVQRSGAAIAPISVAYSLVSTDHQKLKTCVQHARSRVVIVDDATSFAPAMRALSPPRRSLRRRPAGKHRVSRPFLSPRSSPPSRRRPSSKGWTPSRRGRSRASCTPRGSTGAPKATPQPHANLDDHGRADRVARAPRLRRRRAAVPRGDALQPHHGGQLQPQQRHPRRGHDAPRRRQADPGALPAHHREPARGVAALLHQRPPRLRDAL